LVNDFVENPAFGVRKKLTKKNFFPNDSAGYIRLLTAGKNSEQTFSKTSLEGMPEGHW